MFVLGTVAGIFGMFFGENKMYYTADNSMGLFNEEQFSFNSSPKMIFRAVKMIIDKNYVEKISPELYDKLSVNLAKGLLRELGDQNCRFVDNEEMTLIDNAVSGKFEGIGIRTFIKPVNVNGIQEEKLFVASVIPDSPAYKAGIRNGEMIESLNGMEILPYNPLSRAEKLLKDYELHPDRSKIKELQNKIDAETKRIDDGISILDAEKKLSYISDMNIRFKTNRRGYNLKPQKWELKPVAFAENENPSYIRITCFANGAGELLGKAVLQNQKVNSPYIILDMRDLFGGNYDNAKDIAKWFVPGKSLGTLKTKNNTMNLSVTENDGAWKGKVVILVNRGTSKYGELIAAAIRKYCPCASVGENTMGDLSDISIYDLGNGTGYTLTTGEYILPDKITKFIPDIKADAGHNGDKIDFKLIEKALNMAGKGGVKK